MGYARMKRMVSLRVDDAANLEVELGRWHHLDECLLLGLSLTHFGYSVRLDFNHIWASERRIRPDLSEREERVHIELHAVQRLHLEGGLSHQMISHPEQINWGLSEVATVRAESCDVGLRLLLLWENQRRIIIDAMWAELTLPDG